jgi:hypothetical protein
MPPEEVHLEVQSVPTSKNDMKVPPEKEASLQCFTQDQQKQVIIQTINLWFHGADNEDHKLCGHLLT